MGSPDDDADVPDSHDDNDPEDVPDDLCAMLTKNTTKNKNGDNDTNTPGDIRRLLNKPDQE